MIIRGHEHLGRLSTDELVSELLKQRAVLQAAEASREEMRARVHAMEQQYGMHSSEVAAALNRGDLQETEDVTDWLIDFATLRDLDAD